MADAEPCRASDKDDYAVAIALAEQRPGRGSSRSAFAAGTSSVLQLDPWCTLSETLGRLVRGSDHATGGEHDDGGVVIELVGVDDSQLVLDGS